MNFLIFQHQANWIYYKRVGNALVGYPVLHVCSYNFATRQDVCYPKYGDNRYKDNTINVCAYDIDENVCHGKISKVLGDSTRVCSTFVGRKVNILILPN